MTPLVSIVIPTYNSRKFLAEALKSIQSQTYKEYEVVVVDDGSIDNTEEVVKKFKFAIYYRQTHSGQVVARNRGASIAKGKYLTFLDSDDLFLPNKLECQVSYLERHPKINLVYSDGFRFRINRKGRIEERLLSQTGEVVKLSNSPSIVFPSIILKNHFPIHLSLIRKSAFDEIGGFDETLAAVEDWDLWVRFARKYPFAYIDERVGKYRITEGSISSRTKQLLVAQEMMMRKISSFEDFQTLDPEVLSNFEYQRGVNYLGLYRPDLARFQFQKSIQHNPSKIQPRMALLLTLIFGKNTIIFFHIKRGLFGIRTVIKF